MPCVLIMEGTVILKLDLGVLQAYLWMPLGLLLTVDRVEGYGICDM